MHADLVVAPAQLVKTLVPRDAMKTLMARNNRLAAWHLAGHGAALLLCGALVWSAGDSALAWPAMFLLGIVLVHLFAPQHECAHFSAFRSRPLNAAVAWACGLLIVVPQIHFRYEHTDHHTHTNLPAQDPQYIPMPRNLFAYLGYLSAIAYWWGGLSGIARRSFGVLSEQERGFIPRGEQPKVVLEARVMGLAYLVVAALVAAGWRAPVDYWLLPLLLGQPVMRFIRMTEHVGRPLVPDPLRNTRTTRVGAFWRLLAWNMNFHAEHHLAPAVPYHALPRLRGFVGDRMPVQAGYLAGHREIVQQLRALQRAGTGRP